MIKTISLLAVVLSLTTACGNNTPNFSLLADSDNFLQNGGSVNTKIDILWVMDNSGSMATSQSNVANNFQAFISDFQTKGLDFQMAVTTSEAYRSAFTGNTSFEQFRSHNGIDVVTPNTPNLETVFLNLIQAGTSGSGDERAFQSLRQALASNLNSGFLRSDSFLAVIIVSDEDDFSHDDSTFINDYNYAGLHPSQDYINFLDQFTGTSGATRRYNVSSIAIEDQNCLNQLNTSWTGRKIGVRYAELVDATSGLKGSLCDNFAATLQGIASNIIELASQFYLSRIPVPSSITIAINGVPVQPAVFPNPTSGWAYIPESNSIRLFGSSVPPQGATVDVNYDPMGVGQ